MTRTVALLTVMLAFPLLGQETRPTILVDHDDFVIDKSCRISFPKNVVADGNNNGVIHIKATNIVVDFDPSSTLWGTDPKSHPPDTFTGIGVRIDGQKDVTLKGFRIRGFKVGIYASRTDGLIIDGAEIADMFRHHLRSTPAAEDGADWLWPHENDKNEWMTKYGAAIYIEDSKKTSIRNSTGRRGQNGILLDRVDDSKIYDNDFSFLSGWGLALWRSNLNLINCNAFDFCVRGYSHGVYNRGQDSAGILMFEQCTANVIAENSVTHGGDGIFGFAGKEALGESPPPSKDFDYKRRGCNDNYFVANDLSYAPAHGLEMTFSFGNLIAGNRIVGNAICGIWGGYSQDTLIQGNTFEENGGMGYGLERGGVNIEHGFKNVIRHNTFKENRCGVHFWWSDNKDFPKKSWGLANYRGCTDNEIQQNIFDADKLAIHLRAAVATKIGGNQFQRVERETEADAASTIIQDDIVESTQPPFAVPQWNQIGKKTPVGARPHLRGRENIIMTEWGPWDHETPLVRQVASKGAEHVYALHAFTKPAIQAPQGEVTARLDAESKPPSLHIAARKPGLTPYKLTVTNNPEGASIPYSTSGTIISTKWNVRFFPTSAKPHEEPAAWSTDSSHTDFSVELDDLDLRFGNGGPAEALKATGVSDLRSKIGSNHFGLVAETQIPLPRGKWRITTLSDDGVRVTADGKKIIDNWTWHVPTKDSAILDLAEDRTVSLRLEYFELDGYAVLTLDFEESKESK